MTTAVESKGCHPVPAFSEFFTAGVYADSQKDTGDQEKQANHSFAFQEPPEVG